MTWGSHCPRCGKEDCEWDSPTKCDGEVRDLEAALKAAEEDNYKIAEQANRLNNERNANRARAEAAERSAAAYKGQTTKLKRRAKAGTCPCCKRTFSNMAEHMRKQHPDFGPDDDKVVQLKTA